MSQQRRQDQVTNPTLERLRQIILPPIINDSCPLSISTRSIGFMLPAVTRYLDIWLQESSSDESSDEETKIKAPLSAMYRASLAQIEAKIYFSRLNQTRPFSQRSLYDNSLYDLQQPFITHPIARALKSSHCYNLSPVSMIINSIGHVQNNNIHYEPRFLTEMSPLNLRISNLRQYCEEMANINTDAEKRKVGYQLNSIPNARWENENDLQSVVLKNPDHIIPAKYDYDSLSEDWWRINCYLNRIRASRKPEFVGKIDYEGFGDLGILASTHAVPGKSYRLNGYNNINDIGEQTFWSREFLSPLSWSKGVLSLVGEVFDPIDVPHRSQMIAAQEQDISWCEVFRALLH